MDESWSGITLSGKYASEKIDPQNSPICKIHAKKRNNIIISN